MNRITLLATFLALPVLASASTIYLQFDVIQDGEDILYLQGNTLRWQHISDFANGNTTITAKINGIAVPSASLPNNGVWVNGDTGQGCGTLTCPLFDVNTYTLPASLALPSVAQTVTLVSLLNTYGSGGTATTVAGSTCAAAPCTISIPTDASDQQPNSGDAFTLKVDLNDDPLGNTHAYSIGLTFNGVATPEPATLGLSAAGLLALAFFGRKRMRNACSR